MFTWSGCGHCSCRGFRPSPILSLALFLWFCDLDLCPGLAPVPAPVPSLVPAPAPSPARDPAAPFRALAPFPVPSALARTPASLSPVCPSLLPVSAEQNTHRFRKLYARLSECLQSLCYCAEMSEVISRLRRSHALHGPSQRDSYIHSYSTNYSLAGM